MRKTTQRNIAKAGQVFTVVDATMTAGFGFLATTVYVMKPVLAGGLGAISYTLAFLPVVAVACLARGWRALAGLVLLIYVGGFAGNFFSNYGLTAALFKGEIVEAANKNRTFEDRRASIERLKSQRAEKQRQIEFAQHLGTPEGIEKQIAAAELIRDNEARRGGCGIKCEAKTKELTNLQADLENARKRDAAIADVTDLDAAIQAAEKVTAENGEEVSVAAAQAEYLARIFSLNLSPDSNTIDWTLMGVSICISFFISVFAHLCNLVPALNLANDDVPRETQTVSRNPWIPDHRPPDARPLQAETVPNAYRETNTIIVPGQKAQTFDPSYVAQCLAHARAAIDGKTPESA